MIQKPLTSQDLPLQQQQHLPHWQHLWEQAAALRGAGTSCCFLVSLTRSSFSLTSFVSCPVLKASSAFLSVPNCPFLLRKPEPLLQVSALQRRFII